MKKSIVLLSALLLATAVQAQIKPYYGLSAGINLANVAPDNMGSTIARFNGGIMGGFGFSEYFALQGELLYSCTGAGIHVTQVDGVAINGRSHLNINYIILPITVRLFLTHGLSVHAGISPGVYISQRLIHDRTRYKTQYPVRNMDFGIPMGVGYDLGHFGIYARYTYGLVQIFKIDGANQKNSVFSINLTYRI